MQLIFSLPLLALAAADGPNPVTKVLTLLDDLRKKVLLDGEVEQKQYEKYTEWCEDEAVSKQYQIKNGKAKIEDLSAIIEKAGAGIMNADSIIDDMAKVVARNDQDLKAATEIRKKEQADFEAADADLEETIDMIGRAAGIIAKSLKANSFSQVSRKSLKELEDALQVVMKVGLFETKDTDQLQAFLQSDEDDDFLSASAPEAKAYESHGSHILEVLEDMKEKAVAMRNDGQKAELNAKHAYEMLKQSLEGELAADKKTLEQAKADKAAASETKSIAEGDLSMTTKMVTETEAYLQDLASGCQTKSSDWEESQKSRAEELKALTDAIEIIKEKTGAASSTAYGFFEQRAKRGTVKATSTKLPSSEVVDKLTKLGRRSGDVALSQLALRAKAAVEMGSGDVFAKVRSMITEMIDKLVAEAAEEADHKAWCDKETQETQEKIDYHTRKVDKLGAKIDKAVAQIAQLTETIADLQKAVAESHKLQANMDQIRSEEKEAFKVMKKDFTDGIEGLTMALQILREYYAKEPEAEALLQTKKAVVRQPTDPAVHARSEDAATGIIGLLEVAESDFTKMLADAEVEEATSAKAYEKVSHEQAVDTAIKEADIKYSVKEKAGLEKSVAELKDDKEGEQAELDAVTEYFARVRPGCTTKPMTYEERKTRRENEISGLKEALSILEAESPAAFLATRSRTARKI
jgi:hypothetical protein